MRRIGAAAKLVNGHVAVAVLASCIYRAEKHKLYRIHDDHRPAGD